MYQCRKTNDNDEIKSIAFDKFIYIKCRRCYIAILLRFSAFPIFSFISCFNLGNILFLYNPYSAIEMNEWKIEMNCRKYIYTVYGLLPKCNYQTYKIG